MTMGCQVSHDGFVSMGFIYSIKNERVYVFPLFLSCVCEGKLPFMFHIIFNQDPLAVSKDSRIEYNFRDLPVKVFSVRCL